MTKLQVIFFLKSLILKVSNTFFLLIVKPTNAFFKDNKIISLNIKLQRTLHDQSPEGYDRLKINGLYDVHSCLPFPIQRTVGRNNSGNKTTSKRYLFIQWCNCYENGDYLRMTSPLKLYNLQAYRENMKRREYKLFRCTWLSFYI